MVKRLRVLLIAVVLCLVIPAAPALADPAPSGLWPGCQDSTLASGAQILICMPERLGKTWNGHLAIFAHGFVSAYPDRAPEIPISQLEMTTPSIPDMVNGLNYAFATTSYRTNGLAIKDGVQDLLDLLAAFKTAHPLRWYSMVYVVGASEGGLVTTKAMELRTTNPFSGGIAVCGPTGDFVKQVNYLGDFRAVFDYFWPNLLPGDAATVPADLMAKWYDGMKYETQVKDAVTLEPAKTAQLLKVTGASIDASAPPRSPGSPADTATQILWYDVFATSDAQAKLGGNMFDNTKKLYLGSDNDWKLNLGVKRYQATPAAVAALQASYQTTGWLRKPLVNLHTTGDPVVPYWHAQLYGLKVARTLSILSYKHFKIDRYGHCNVNQAEIMAAFQWIVIRTGGFLFTNAREVLGDDAAYQRFLELTQDMEPMKDAGPGPGVEPTEEAAP